MAKSSFISNVEFFSRFPPLICSSTCIICYLISNNLNVKNNNNQNIAFLQVKCHYLPLTSAICVPPKDINTHVNIKLALARSKSRAFRMIFLCVQKSNRFIFLLNSCQDQSTKHKLTSTDYHDLKDTITFQVQLTNIPSQISKKGLFFSFNSFCHKRSPSLVTLSYLYVHDLKSELWPFMLYIKQKNGPNISFTYHMTKEPGNE